MWKIPEQYRANNTLCGIAGDSFGAFQCASPVRPGYSLTIIASDGMNPDSVTEWQHVSAHVYVDIFGNGDTVNLTPSWDEMCFIKDLFWDDEDAVVQFHPPKSQYVNIHKATLHLWHYNGTMPLPPKEYV